MTDPRNEIQNRLLLKLAQIEMDRIDLGKLLISTSPLEITLSPINLDESAPEPRGKCDI